jgi:hypothetical protein
MVCFLFSYGHLNLLIDTVSELYGHHKGFLLLFELFGTKSSALFSPFYMYPKVNPSNFFEIGYLQEIFTNNKLAMILYGYSS